MSGTSQTAAGKYFRSAGNHITVTRLQPIPDASTFADFARYVADNVWTLAATRDEFLQADDPAQKKLKHACPYYVPGVPDKAQRRGRSGVAACNLIFLDVDDAAMAAAALERLHSEPLRWPHLVYHTSRSTAEKPRIRVAVAARAIPPANYPEAVSTVARALGLSEVAGESFSEDQAMFFPVIFRGETALVHSPVVVTSTDGAPFTVNDLDGRDLLPAVGRTTVARDPSDDNAIEFIRAPLDDFTLEDAAEALAHIDPGLPEPQWINVVRALKHQFSGDLENAYAVLDSWSSKGRGYDREENRQKWERVKSNPSDRQPVTIRTLVKMAEEKGWKPGRRWFERLLAWIDAPARTLSELDGAVQRIAATPDLTHAQVEHALKTVQRVMRQHRQEISVGALNKDYREAVRNGRNPGSKSDARPPWSKHLVYVGGTVNQFYNYVNGAEIVPAAFNKVYIDCVPDGLQMAPDVFALKVCGVKSVGDYGYAPGEGVFYDGIKTVEDTETGEETESAVQFVNTYRRTYARANAKHGPKAAELLTEHICTLIAEPKLRLLLWDWMAYLVQNPGKKVRWAPLIQGAQGCGKSTIGNVMIDVLGATNAREVSSDLLKSTFNEWATSRQLVIVGEIHNTGDRKHAAYDVLKAPITDQTLTIDIKNARLKGVPNVTNYIAFTNHHNAFPVESTDRRWLIIKSQLQTADAVEAVKEQMIAFNRWREDPAHAGALRWALENHTVSRDFDPNACPRGEGLTRYKDEMARDSESPLKACVRDTIEGSEDPLCQPDLVALKHLAAAVGEQDRSIREQHVANVLQELEYFLVGRLSFPTHGKLKLYAKRGGPFDGAHPDKARREFARRLEQLLPAPVEADSLL